MLNFSWSLQLIILVIFAFSSVIASTSFVILIVHFWYHYGCKPSIWISDIAIDQWLICFYSPMIDFWELKTVFPTRSQSCHGRKTSIVHDQNWGRKGTNISVQIIKLLLNIPTSGRQNIVLLCWMQDSNLGCLRHQIASWPNARSQTDRPIEDQAKL